MADTTKTIVAACIVLLLACGVLGIRYAWEHRDGRCICQNPRELIKGNIGYGGPFNNRVYYSLGWAGVYEHSGDVCICWRRTTEAEYNRQMYGHEKHDGTN